MVTQRFGEPLSLDHRPLLEKPLKSLGHGLSEYCFINLYLFRQVHQYLVIQNEMRCISGETYDRISYLMPVCDLARIDTKCLIPQLKHYGCIYPVSEPNLQWFGPDLFEFDFNPDNSDYVYAVEKLKTYPGRKRSPQKTCCDNFNLNTW